MCGFSQWSAAAVVFLVLGCGDDGGVEPPPGPTTGSLTVTIIGLPTGSNASVTVAGPAGFTRSLTASETLSGLTPGSYTITAASVTAADGRYAATPPAQTVTVVAGTVAATANLNYALATGGLVVSVTGLPNAVNAVVTVTGPNGFTRAVTATTTISPLEPGSYTVTAGDVTNADNRYAVGTPAQTVAVTAGGNSSAAVTYALATGRLTVNVSGLPAGFGIGPLGANAAITVTGPQGFTRTVTATSTLTLLAPGLYATTASNVMHGGFTWRPTPASQANTVVASTTPSTANVTYAAIDGSLTVTLTGLPAGVDASVNVTGPTGFSQALTRTTTLSMLAPGTYTINASNVIAGATTYVPTPGSQTATVNVGNAATAIVGYTAPVNLALTSVVTGLTRPVHLASPPNDSRLFVVEQTGRIRIVQGGTLLTQPFLDLTSKVLPVTDFDDEHGLLGLAFPPQYPTSGRFFVFYMDPAQNLVIERYQVSSDPNIANTTGSIVLSIPHTLKKSHNGGGLAFGPDGFLYVSVGDGGCCADPLLAGQNLNTLLGKILRIDVNGAAPYSIPPSNPFVGQPGRRGEIYAYGLRNPWRFDVDPVASVLYVADVGEDDTEEVNAVSLSVAGPNFGWSIMEGSNCFQPGCTTAGLRLPVVEYAHNEGCSVTGGFVYRGSAIPELQGNYFYSDWCSGFLRSFFLSNGVALLKKDWGIPSPGNVTSFGRDSSGELYVLTQAGTVYRIVRQ